MTTQLDSAVRLILAALLGGLWQAPLFALAAWLVLRFRANVNAATRHSILAAALFASAIVPVVSAGVSTMYGVNSERAARHMQPPNEAGAARAVEKRALEAPLAGHGTAAVPATPSIPSSSAFERLNLPLPSNIALALVAVWLCGAAFGLAGLLVSLLTLERLKRDALPLAVEYRAQLGHWAAAAKGSRNVRLCRSGDIAIPMAIGLFDAMILLPERLLEELAPHEVDDIVLHELAHLRRADDWFNAFERIAFALWFFNPAIAWLVRELDLEREIACDDWVLLHGEALPYATCLAKVAESIAWPHRPMPAPGVFATRRAMSLRIERLLAKQRDVRVRTAFGPAGAALTMLGVLAAVAAVVSPSIAYGNGAITAPAPTYISQRPVPERAQARPERAQARPERPDIIVDALPAAAVVTRVAENTAAASAGNGRIVATAKALDYGEDIASRALGLDPSYVRAMRRRLGKSLGTGDIAALKALGVSPAYIDELEASGLEHLSAKRIRDLRALDVTPAYVRALVRAGYADLSDAEIQELEALSVDSAFISRAAARGLRNLSVRQLLELKATESP